MAVPSSGELSWGKIANERLNSSYATFAGTGPAPVFNIYKGEKKEDSKHVPEYER